MQAVIMAGGYGTRLRPLTDRVPKPMVEIIDKPIIRYTIEHLRDYGIDDIIVTLGYKADIIKDYLRDGEWLGVKVRSNVEEKPLGTAGGIKNVEDMIEGTFLVVSGDAFTDIDIDEMIDTHLSHKGLLTMAVKYVDDVTGFGVVETDSRGRINRFVEKPLSSDGGLINTGIYMIEKEVLKEIPHGKKYDFARDLFPKLTGKMQAYRMSGFWSDIGTLSSYYLTNNYVSLNLEHFAFTTYE